MAEARTTTVLAFSAALLVCVGCSTLINPDTDLLGGDPDAGSATDAGAVDAGSFDAGSPETDSGPVPCDPFPPSCRGDALVSCGDGVENVRECQSEGAYCESGACHAWVCTPGTRACSTGLASVVVCDARGTGDAEIDCPAGACDPATGACTGIDPTACDGLPEIEPGDTRTTDLCAESNDNTFRSMADCDPRVPANAGDRIYALHIESPGNYRIELEDNDILEDIDTVIYLRNQCDEERSQLACNDDTMCEGGFPISPDCRDGFDLGHSRIELFLEPGTYYIVADGFIYDMGRGNTSECGDVRLRVRSID